MNCIRKEYGEELMKLLTLHGLSWSSSRVWMWQVVTSLSELFGKRLRCCDHENTALSYEQLEPAGCPCFQEHSYLIRGGTFQGTPVGRFCLTYHTHTTSPWLTSLTSSACGPAKEGMRERGHEVDRSISLYGDWQEVVTVSR